MIIQCDQCNTKFRLDDAKVPDKGVKVRCAKCKHIFKVQREVHPDETDFDFLLSGLGASASDAETGVSQPGEAALSSTGREEGRMFAEAADKTRVEPAETPVAGGAEQAGREDFGEDFFAVNVKEEPAPLEEKGFEPGEFPFEGEQADVPAGTAATPETGKGETVGFEFGEYPFVGEESTTQSGLSGTPSAGSVETEGFDFAPTDFGADESAAMKVGEGLEGIAVGQPTEEGFSFGKEPAPPEAENQGMEWKPEPPAESEETFGFSAVAVPPLREKEAETATFAAEEETKEAETKHIDSGDIEGGVFVAGTGLSKTEEIKPALEETTVPPEPVPEKLTAPSLAPSTPSAEEELPPLAISTRRKGSSIFAIVVTAIAVLIVLAIAGFGFYLFKEGPTAFDKLKLSFLARWVG
ncbi:MAG TPA: zinc-ribbon domain-containing protein, partial [Geobacteraceae bacterium]|nr:zinc-ribbon domain-containing protein [Geobacteraceae bacterium]